MKVHVSAHLNDRSIALIEATLADDDVVFRNRLGSDDEKAASLAEAEVVFGNLHKTQLLAAPRLRWMQLESIGFDHYVALGPDEMPPDLQISNLKGMFAAPVTETAIGGVLTLYRRIDELTRAKDARDWRALELRPQTRIVSGTSSLVLGVGAIGSHCGRVLEGLGSTVTTFGRSKDTADLATFDELDNALRCADLVFVTLPGTPATDRLLDERRLGLMKPHAILANVGRGSVIDEEALVRALTAGTIGGAVVDVTWKEPLPEDHPLWACRNAVITQHTAGGYNDELPDKARLFLDNLALYRSAGEMFNLVDFDKGY